MLEVQKGFQSWSLRQYIGLLLYWDRSIVHVIHWLRVHQWIAQQAHRVNPISGHQDDQDYSSCQDVHQRWSLSLEISVGQVVESRSGSHPEHYWRSFDSRDVVSTSVLCNSMKNRSVSFRKKLILNIYLSWHIYIYIHLYSVIWIRRWQRYKDRKLTSIKISFFTENGTYQWIYIYIYLYIYIYECYSEVPFLLLYICIVFYEQKNYSGSE